MTVARTGSWLALSLLSVLAVACGGSAAELETFPIGAPIGVATHALVGPEGGTLAFGDDGIHITVPAGALDAPVELGIQEITRTAPHGHGRAFRLTPHGQQFAEPVTIAFAIDDEDRADAASLAVAYQDERGAWIALTDAAVDESAATIAVQSTHFSDWTYFGAFDIEAEATTVAVGRSVGLVVTSCIPAPDEDGLVPLVSDCRPMPDPSLVREPSVNGTVGGSGEVGTVAQSGATLTYTAPAAVPSSGAVAISAQIEIPGRPAKLLVIAEITVIESSDVYRGTAWAEPGGFSAVAEVTWTAVEESDGVVTYAPSGTLTMTYPGCTVSPTTGTIAPEDGWLMIDWTDSPPRYHGGGITGWDATVACDDDEPQSSPIGTQWLNAGEGVAHEDGSVLAGENGWWRWSFSR